MKPNRDTLTRYFSALGKMGGPARARSLTPARRKAIASKAGKARWARAKRKVKP